MSEKIYAWLLRVYPSHFREAYGDPALQLFRDRSRHERGFFPVLRLWLDLLADLAISVPREYSHVKRAVIGASAPRSSDGTPSFHVLEGESPGVGALLLGGVLSLVAAGASIPIGHLTSYQRFRAVSGTRAPANTRLPASSRWTEEATGNAGEKNIAPATAEIGLRSAGPSVFQSKPIPGRIASGFPQLIRPQYQSHEASRVKTEAVVENVTLNAAERERVIDAVIANLKAHYIDPAVARKMGEALLRHEEAGDYTAVKSGPALADRLSAELREVSHDLHLEVVYSRTPLPDHPSGATPEGVARYQKAMEQQKCTFEKVEILPRNIGYLKLNSFPDSSICGSMAAAAMASLNHADAIIFDLRDNRGGYPNNGRVHCRISFRPSGVSLQPEGEYD
jgi:hypothetical protein